MKVQIAEVQIKTERLEVNQSFKLSDDAMGSFYMTNLNQCNEGLCNRTLASNLKSNNERKINRTIMQKKACISRQNNAKW